MQTTIVARVADPIRDPDARKLIQKSAGGVEPRVTDDVQISSEARRMARASSSQTGSNWEKARIDRLTSVTAKVQSQTYALAPEVVDQIASRIVALA